MATTETTTATTEHEPHAAPAFDEYAERMGTADDQQTALCDLLADLRHLADARGLESRYLSSMGEPRSSWEERTPPPGETGHPLHLIRALLDAYATTDETEPR